MRLWTVGEDAKGWLAGPWDGSPPIAVGYAHDAIDEPHLHRGTTEMFLVASGNAVVRVEREDLTLRSGDVLILEPGEAHTFLSASDDYTAFVIHTGGDGQDKERVNRDRLGL